MVKHPCFDIYVLKAEINPVCSTPPRREIAGDSFQAAVIVEGQMAERGMVSMRTEGRAGEGLRAGRMVSMRIEGDAGEGL